MKLFAKFKKFYGLGLEPPLFSRSPSSFLSYYKELKAKIKGVFSRSYCNLLCHKVDCNTFTNDWADC